MKSALLTLPVWILTSQLAVASWLSPVASPSDLHNATITVYFAGNPTGVTNTIWNDGGSLWGDGFYFQVQYSADTAQDTWTLDNLTSDIITGIRFDLYGSRSVFDSGTSPSTPGSGPETPLCSAYNNSFGDGCPLAAPAPKSNDGIIGPTSSYKFNLWNDPSNQGDIFESEFISFGGKNFDQHHEADWYDDTDLVSTPEPGSLLLTATGVATAVGMFRRRLAFAK